MKKICLFLISSFFLIFLFSPTKVLAQIEECNPNWVTVFNTRPAPCNVCYITDLLTPSCATSFNAYNNITYLKNEGEIIKRDWDGTVQIDASEVKIPFVGKESEASEVKYLADYLEGTNEYYGNYENQNTITNYQGVLRKLTPIGYQNQVKKELITRAEKEIVHNYEVKYTDRFCWSASLLVEIADFTIETIIEKLANTLGFKKPHWPDITQYCLYETSPWDWLEKNSIQFAFKFIPSFIIEKAIKDGGIVNLIELKPPPDPNEEDYQEKYLEWKNLEDGLWYRLWQAAPMLSREDTPGEIDPYLAIEHEEDKFEITNESATVEKVPHVARLYESSQIISQTLTPKGKGVEMVKTPTIPETTPPFTCFKEKYIPVEDGDNLCLSNPITATLNATEEFSNPDYPCPELKLDPETQLYILNPDCLEKVEKDVSRGIGVNLYHPYLDEIWSYTANANGGFFNIFRPYSYSAFEDIDAAAELTYSFTSGEVSPEKGLFFFNHLGGIQTAKKWVVNEALWPYK
jgi:hypothetical protein